MRSSATGNSSESKTGSTFGRVGIGLPYPRSCRRTTSSALARQPRLTPFTNNVSVLRGDNACLCKNFASRQELPPCPLRPKCQRNSWRFTLRCIEDEPAPKLIVDSPLPEGLALGVFWAQYRVENLHIYTGIRCRRSSGISPRRAPSRHRRRPTLVVGGRE